jgi:putative thioredoxin
MSHTSILAHFVPLAHSIGKAAIILRVSEFRNAVDLSQLSQPSQDKAVAPASGDSGQVSYVRNVSEADFNEVASRSVQYPVVVLLTMPSAPETHALDETMIRLTNAAGGRWLLARVDVSQSPRLASALGVQAVPTVIALIGGQAAPLFQGTQDAAMVSQVLDQVVQLAVASGIAGRAQPVPGGPVIAGDAADNDPRSDPRFNAADEAIAGGDFAGALAEFDKLLVANPKDQLAAAGKAQVGLLIRTQGVDAAAALSQADANPKDVDAVLAAADVEVLNECPESAFARLIELVRQTTNDERARARTRLLELFATQDPASDVVQKARRDLTAALF